MRSSFLGVTDHITSIIESIVVISITIAGAIIANQKSDILYLFLGIIISETIIIVALVIYISNIKKRNMLMLNNLIFKLHSQFVHKTRNHMHKLNSIKKKVKSIKNNKDEYNEIYMREYEKVKEVLQPVVNCISEILSDYSKQTISSCIKIFMMDELKENPLDRHVTTFVRSENTSINRGSDEADFIDVKKNTDFRRLCNGRAMFACGDLRALHKKGLYKNDSKNWQNKYNSSLVVPIRYKPEIQIPKKKSNIYILGFICIDSEKNNIQWEERDCLEVQFLGMFADTIYMYLNEFIDCFLGEC